MEPDTGTMRDALEALLVREEGEVLHAYDDHLGFATIGVGRLIDKRKGGGITREESRYLLRNDIARIEAQLDEALPWWTGLSDNRRLVLAAMVFQLGLSGVLKFKNTLGAIQGGRYDEAARGLLASLWAKQTPERAERMAEMMRRG